MASIKVSPLKDDLPYGAMIAGVSFETLKDEKIQRQILDVFEDRGLIVFKGVESSSKLQVELSKLFGPPQDHPFAAIKRVDNDTMPGVIDLYARPDDAMVVELEGKRLNCWSPWHFDSAYTKKLIRAGVLRPIIMPPEGGLTGFADGIQLYNAISLELRAKFEDLQIIYDPSVMLSNLRFGMPKDWRYINLNPDGEKLLASTKGLPRSVHPAIWRRKSGEPVLHVSLQNAAGIFGHENPEGDALLETLLQEIQTKMKPYWHKYELTDMLVFDNWRFVHSISGNDPKYPRRMHRTTAEGDYGLGRFESELVGETSAATLQ
jgi:taurine dioxygenase